MMQLTLNRALEAVAADALYAATSVEELQAAWGEHCDEFADETPERARLLKLFDDRLALLKPAERMAKLLRAG
jgi:sirohydrochlorin ferrochelatase